MKLFVKKGTINNKLIKKNTRCYKFIILVIIKNIIHNVKTDVYYRQNAIFVFALQTGIRRELVLLRVTVVDDVTDGP